MKQFILISIIFLSTIEAASFVISDESITPQALDADNETGEITSSGTLTTSSDAVTMTTGSNQSFTNNGTMTVSGGDGISGTVTSTDSSINNAGTITIDNGLGILLYGDNLSISNTGTISTSGYETAAIFSFGDYLQVTNTGTISSSGDETTAIFSFGDYSQLTNTGTISSSGEGTTTIFSSGDFLQMMNSGLISTAGDISVAVFSEGDAFTVENTGTISTLGNTAAAIYSTGNSLQVINKALVSTEGSSAIGIFSSGDISTIENLGTIATNGSSASGVSQSGENSTFLNRGTIITTGTEAPGVVTLGNGQAITNSGLIRAQGTDSAAIYVQGDNSAVVNSGTLKSDVSLALFCSGSSPSLTLLEGAVINGAFFTTEAINLTLDQVYNLSLTQTAGSGGYGTITSNVPYVVNGLQLASIDPTALGMQADMVQDVTDSILNNIYHQREALTRRCPPKCGYWAGALGSYRQRMENIGYFNEQGGFLVGKDWCGQWSSFGLFGGGSFGQGQLQNKSQLTRMNNWLGGFHFETIHTGAVMGVSSYFASASLSNNRNVQNNLAGGNAIQIASSSPNGFLFGSDVFCLFPFIQRPTWGAMAELFVRYTGLYLGSYSEAGTNADLSVNSRNIGLLKVRTDLAFPLGWECEAPFVTPFVGVAGRFQTQGTKINGTLISQALTFADGVPENIVEFLVGFRSERMIARSKLYANFQALFDSNQSQRIFGQAGFTF